MEKALPPQWMAGPQNDNQASLKRVLRLLEIIPIAENNKTFGNQQILILTVIFFQMLFKYVFISEGILTQQIVAKLNTLG